MSWSALITSGVARLLVDGGLVVLIWLVQLVIYPSFVHVATDRLRSWHGTYTTRVSLVVVPLMFGQAALVGWDLARRGAVTDWVVAVLVAGAWLVTFLRAVPLHGRIAEGADDEATLRSLVWWNGPRTALWSAVFAIDLVLLAGVP